MTERKGVLLRMDPGVHDALAEAGRLPGHARQMHRPGRPPRDPSAG